MQSTNDKSFKQPSHVGKIADLRATVAKLNRGVPIEELTAKENTYILQAYLAIRSPVILQSLELLDDFNAAMVLYLSQLKNLLPPKRTFKSSFCRCIYITPNQREPNS